MTFEEKTQRQIQKGDDFAQRMWGRKMTPEIEDIVCTLVYRLQNNEVREALANYMAESPSNRYLFETFLTDYIEACGQQHGETAVMSAFVAVLRRRQSKFDLMLQQACDFETALSLAVENRKFKGHKGLTIRKKLTPWVATRRTFCNPTYWETVLDRQVEKPSED